jgi:2-dehydro-3-deoxygluconokinase
MKKVVTFGEVMMRLSPPDNLLIKQADSFDVHFGGSEYNVAAGLVSLGFQAICITRLPDNPIGLRALNAIRASGVIVPDDILYKGGRLGIYFVEPGSSPRPNRVVYDRDHSALIKAASENSFDWDKYLDNASWFHVSGITPALSEKLAETTLGAIKKARSKNIPVSFDINFRVKLWTAQKARETLEPMLKMCDLVITTEEDLDRVFDMKEKSPQSLAKEAKEKLGVKMVAVTLRELKTVRLNRWGGCAFNDDGYSESRMYDVEIIDRIGAGDSFTAGFIAGLMMNRDMKYSLDLASAFSALKQTIPGDICPVSMGEVEELMKKGDAGRIQR